LSAREFPQLLQKFAPGGLRWLQLEQVWAKTVPQFEQNFADCGLLAWQLGQFMDYLVFIECTKKPWSLSISMIEISKKEIYHLIKDITFRPGFPAESSSCIIVVYGQNLWVIQDRILADSHCLVNK
jgi:hypothetical protein